MYDNLIHISGTSRNLYWYWPNGWNGNRPQPFCKTHMMPIPVDEYLAYSSELICDDCDKPVSLGRPLHEMQTYVERKILGKSIAQLKVVRIDTSGAEIMAPVSRAENDDYFVEAKLTDTEGGLQLMVTAGKKDGTSKKVQLFVEPGTKRMNFDRSADDQHPAGLFTEVTAKFKDASVAITDECAQKPSAD